METTYTYWLLIRKMRVEKSNCFEYLGTSEYKHYSKQNRSNSNKSANSWTMKVSVNKTPQDEKIRLVYSSSGFKNRIINSWSKLHPQIFQTIPSMKFAPPPLYFHCFRFPFKLRIVSVTLHPKAPKKGSRMTAWEWGSDCRLDARNAEFALIPTDDW